MQARRDPVDSGSIPGAGAGAAAAVGSGSSCVDDDVPSRRVVAVGAVGSVLLVDSVTQLQPHDAGAWAVTGSHGGTSSARYALACPAKLVVFNDAGVGKDAAGIVALERLQAHGRAAATVGHRTARIGDAADAWAHGVVSHANAAAAALGVVPGLGLQEAVARAMRAVAGAPEALTAPSSPPSR